MARAIPLRFRQSQPVDALEAVGVGGLAYRLFGRRVEDERLGVAARQTPDQAI